MTFLHMVMCVSWFGQFKIGLTMAQPVPLYFLANVVSAESGDRGDRVKVLSKHL